MFCIAYWTQQGDLRKCSPNSLGSFRQYLRSFGPIAISFPLSVVFNNKGLTHIGAGLSAVVSTLAPVVTAILQHALGRSVSPKAWLGILAAVTGAIVIGSGKP